MRSEDVVATQRSGGGAAGVVLAPPHAASARSTSPVTKQAEAVFVVAIELNLRERGGRRQAFQCRLDFMREERAKSQVRVEVRLPLRRVLGARSAGTAIGAPGLAPPCVIA
jgi:hypothetical protein